jgi:nucleotide-binding universal stress UspA family protein
VSSAFSKMLVPIDDSEPAHAAIAAAIRLARECDAEVVFANAIDARVIVDMGELVKDQARALLAQALDEAKSGSVKASAEILVGGLVPTLTAFAAETRADLIVMGTHGRRGLEHFVLGSATEGVLRTSGVPVLTLHSFAAPDRPAPLFARLFVALDDSDPADAALALAVRYAGAAGAKVTCCSVVESSAVVRDAAVYGFDPEPILEQARETANALLGRAAALAHDSGVSVHGVVREDDAIVEGIIEAAREEGADLIVMGTHGRRGMRRFLLGSVSEGVVRGSSLPVLVTRAAQGPATISSSARAK